MNVQENLTAFVKNTLNPILVEEGLLPFEIIIQGFSDPLSSALEYPRANIVETGRSFNVEFYTSEHSILLGLAVQTEDGDVLREWMTNYVEIIEDTVRSHPRLGGWCLLSDVKIETDARIGIGLIAVTLKVEVLREE